MTMCGAVWLMRESKPTLSTPLDIAHLIFLQAFQLAVTFWVEGKHFSVDGAYNCRYEIVENLIDKSQIRDIGERLTQPDQVVTV